MSQYKYLIKAGERWRFDATTQVRGSNGRFKRVSGGGFLTKKEAALHERCALDDVERHGFTESNKITFRAVYEKWYQVYERGGIAESTAAKTQDNFRLHILPLFGEKPIKEISIEDCQNAVQLWADKGYKKYRTFLKMTSKVFEHAMLNKIRYDDPTRAVWVPRKPAKSDRKTEPKDNFYTEDQLQAFLKAARQEANWKAYTIFNVLAFTGMRKGEAMSLRWTDLDFKKHTLTISRTLTRGKNNRLYISPNPKTESSKRTLFLDEKTISILKQWQKMQAQEFQRDGIKSNGDEQLIFTNDHNGFMQPMYPNKWMDKIIAAANLKRITPHGWRHSWATIGNIKNINPVLIAAELGHKSVQTTQNVYTGVTKDQLAGLPDLFVE